MAEDSLQLTTFDQIATLVSQVAQNNTSMALTYYNMFYSTTPQDIVLKLYDANGVLQEFTVPNRAKDFNYIKNGSGSPQGTVAGSVGTLYQDTLNGTLYIKSVGTDTQGWVELVNNELLISGTNNPNGIVSASQGTLYINVSTATLYIKSTSSGNTGWIQVNVNLSNVADIDLSNITTTAQGNIRSAITGAASTIAGSNLVTDKVLISDAYGKVIASDIAPSNLEVLDGLTATTTELNYCDGVTSSIQTQLDGKQASIGYTPVNKAGDTMAGQLTVNSNIIGTNLKTTTGGQLFAGSIEFSNIASGAGYGGYIDFHYNGNTGDYTSRIIEDSQGVLTITCNRLKGSNIGDISLPSASVIAMGLGASGTTYTAPANGWIYTNFYANTDASAHAQVNVNNGEYVNNFDHAREKAEWMTITPIRKGVKYTLGYKDASLLTHNFIYVQSEI